MVFKCWKTNLRTKQGVMWVGKETTAFSNASGLECEVRVKTLNVNPRTDKNAKCTSCGHCLYVLLCSVLAYRTLSFLLRMRCQLTIASVAAVALGRTRFHMVARAARRVRDLGQTLRPCRYWMAAVLCAVQGRVQQMAGVAQCRARPMLLENAGCKKKGDVACEAMDALAEDRAEQLEAKRFCHQMCSEFAEAETNCEKVTGKVLEEGRRARLACEDGDHACGVFGDHGGTTSTRCSVQGTKRPKTA